jgi:hypothetical protein
MQIKQALSLPCPSNQDLNGDVFSQKFVKPRKMPIFRNAGWKTLKKSLPGDICTRCILDHTLNYKHFEALGMQTVLKLSDTLNLIPTINLYIY